MIGDTKQLRIRIQELLKSIAAILRIHALNVASLHTSSRMASLLSVESAYQVQLQPLIELCNIIVGNFMQVLRMLVSGY